MLPMHLCATPFCSFLARLQSTKACRPPWLLQGWQRAPAPPRALPLAPHLCPPQAARQPPAAAGTAGGSPGRGPGVPLCLGWGVRARVGGCATAAFGGGRRAPASRLSPAECALITTPSLLHTAGRRESPLRASPRLCQREARLPSAAARTHLPLRCTRPGRSGAVRGCPRERWVMRPVSISSSTPTSPSAAQWRCGLQRKPCRPTTKARRPACR